MNPPPPPGPDEQPSEHAQNLARTLAEVSERATLLVREEIELAKAEVSEKAVKLLRGAVVGAAAGVFVLMAVVFALVGFAWLLYYYLPGNAFTYFWGFFAMAVILLGLGALAGLVAARAVKKSSPVPKMAIEEARKIRETVSSGSDTAQRAHVTHAAPATQAAPDQQPETVTPPVASTPVES